MSIEENVISAPLAIKGDPSTACFETVAQFVQALPTFLVALIPKSVTNVIVSNIQPTSGNNDSIWFRTNNAGVFLGVYVFSDGSWVQLFPVPNGIFRMYGNSDTVPEGYILANSDQSGLNSGQRNFLQSQWYPAGVGPWTIFDVVYIGI